MKVKLCIDPGHGNKNTGSGYDPGAESAGHTEADIALQWALTLNWVLSQAGIKTFLTRDDDSDPDPVGTRDDRAEAAGCTHFIALHCNCATGTASGTETYYRDARDKGLAAPVQRAALAALGLHDRGLKTESDSQHTSLAVFDFDGPACLVELGFIDNTTDRGRMQERDRRVKFADALCGYFKGLMA